MEKFQEQTDISRELSPEKEETLKLCYKNLEKYGEDGIDPKIKDTIAYLNVLGFNTHESCEGHVDHGNLSAYVGMNAPEQPQWRFVGQEESYKKAAQKHKVTLSEIFDYLKPKYDVLDWTPPENEEQLALACNEAWEETPKKEETEEFKLWRAKTDEMKEKLDLLMQEFYRERNAADDVKLVLSKGDNPEYRASYLFFLHNGGDDYENYVGYDEREKLSKEELEVLKKRLEARQNEMTDFTEFLKEKYRQT
jgi:hypothetical protein